MKAPTAILFLAFLFFSSMVRADGTVKSVPENKSSAIDEMLVHFKKVNSNINWVQIYELREAYYSDDYETGYFVVARGTLRGESSSDAKLENELFGFFATDMRMTKVYGKVDIVQSKRWYDYWCNIKALNRASVTLKCTDGYGVDEEIRKYTLAAIPWPGKVAANHSLQGRRP